MSQVQASEIDMPDVVEEVRKAHLSYEDALSANDVDSLDTYFWKDPRTVRYGPNGSLIGHAAISAFRRARVSKRSSRMMRHLHITTFGRDFAVTNQESVRVETGIITRQSQTWVRTSEGWCIVSAHVSDQPAHS